MGMPVSLLHRVCFLNVVCPDSFSDYRGTFLYEQEIDFSSLYFLVFFQKNVFVFFLFLLKDNKIYSIKVNIRIKKR